MSASVFSELDTSMMKRALELARLGLYTTDPNPRVGCVLAQGPQIVGEGWHRKTGEPHAEVHALAAAGEHARGATAYVTLEPCSHHGRTPPCADALIRAGVTRVVSALDDPYPLVNGAGLGKLRAAGIAVQTGLLEAEAQELNIGFVARMRTGLPWVRVKIGASLDGRTALANGLSRWITNEESRADVQHWRARSSAVLTGIGTVLADDPQLNVRAANIELLGRQPLRVICDADLRTPATARIFEQAGSTLLFAARTAQDAALHSKAETILAPADAAHGVDLRTVLQILAKRGCNEVLVEAGPTLSGRLLELQLADELLVYLAPVLLGHDAQPMLKLAKLANMDERLEYELCEITQFGSDLRLRYRPKRFG